MGAVVSILAFKPIRMTGEGSDADRPLVLLG
jgi:hypothetical protein